MWESLHLQTDTSLSTIKATLDKSLTSAVNVGKASTLRMNFFSTKESIPKSKLMSALNVGKPATRKELSTRGSTLEKSPVSAVNVGSAAEITPVLNSAPKSSQWREASQLCYLWEVLHLQKQTHRSPEDPHWRKAVCVQ